MPTIEICQEFKLTPNVPAALGFENLPIFAVLGKTRIWLGGAYSAKTAALGCGALLRPSAPCIVQACFRTCLVDS